MIKNSKKKFDLVIHIHVHVPNLQLFSIEKIEDEKKSPQKTSLILKSGYD